MGTEYTMEMAFDLNDLKSKIKAKETQGWRCEGDVCVFISIVDTENYFQAMVKNNSK
jgi:hypothetical protein